MKLFAVMLLGLMISTSVVLAQDNDTDDSGSITIGESVSGEFEVGVRDRYTLEIEDSSTLNIYLDGTDDTDTVLRVYNEGDDEPLDENDDRGDGSLYSALYGLEVSKGDTLIVEAATFGDEGEGEYTLRVTLPPTIEDAGEITLGEPVEATFPENTRERYALDVEDTTALNITLEGEDDLDTYLRIYVEGEEEPAVQNNDVEAENVAAGFTNLVVPGGTSLVIEAATAGDAFDGDFTLTVEEADVDLEAETPVPLTEDATLDDVCEDASDIEEPARLQYLTPEDVLDDDVDYGAVFCTEAGNFRVDLYEKEAPIATNSFVYLASRHFFDNTTFHRVIEDFVIQGGDPTGSGFGGPGYEFVNETDNDLSFGGIGVLGLANAGPDTNGSQFFVTMAPVARLDGGYTIFGQVQEGMGSVYDVEVRDPDTATEPGTLIYTVIIVTQPLAEA
jgi:cyclophilin family peptidyl-prolyl cis-trans isomerase